MVDYSAAAAGGGCRSGPGVASQDGDGSQDTLSNIENVNGSAQGDSLSARDGRPEGITCGAGEDSVTADTIDVVASDCEHVTLPTPPTITAGDHRHRRARRLVHERRHRLLDRHRCRLDDLQLHRLRPVHDHERHRTGRRHAHLHRHERRGYDDPVGHRRTRRHRTDRRLHRQPRELRHPADRRDRLHRHRREPRVAGREHNLHEHPRAAYGFGVGTHTSRRSQPTPPAITATRQQTSPLPRRQPTSAR